MRYLTLYSETLLEKDLQRFRNFLEAKITPDGKYVIYDGLVYDITTGDEVPMNEEFSLSDVLHLGVDIASGVADYFSFGTAGAVIDILHACAYLVEAYFKDSQKEKDGLYMMAMITLACALLPGPLQAAGPILKNFIKSGAEVVGKGVLWALSKVAIILDKLLLTIPSKIKSALNSSLGKKILGRLGSKKLDNLIASFQARIRIIMARYIPSKSLAKGVSGRGGRKALAKTLAAKLPRTWIKSIKIGKYGPQILKNLGFKKGYRYGYHYIGPNNKLRGARMIIEDIGPNFVKVRQVFAKGKIPVPPPASIKMNIDTFIYHHVVLPKRASKFSKFLSHMADYSPIILLKQLGRWWFLNDEEKATGKDLDMNQIKTLTGEDKNANSTSETSQTTIPPNTENIPVPTKVSEQQIELVDLVPVQSDTDPEGYEYVLPSEPRVLELDNVNYDQSSTDVSSPTKTEVEVEDKEEFGTGGEDEERRQLELSLFGEL